MSILIRVQKIQNSLCSAGGCSSADGNCLAMAQRYQRDFGEQRAQIPKYCQYLSFFYLED